MQPLQPKRGLKLKAEEKHREFLLRMEEKRRAKEEEERNRGAEKEQQRERLKRRVFRMCSGVVGGERDERDEKHEKGFVVKSGTKAKLVGYDDKTRSKTTAQKPRIRSKTTTHIRMEKRPSNNILQKYPQQKAIGNKLPPMVLNAQTQNQTEPLQNKTSEKFPYPKPAKVIPERPKSQDKKLSPSKNRDNSPEQNPLPIVKRNIETITTSKPRSFQYITDVNEWLKKNRLPADTKVFIVSAIYSDFKAALLRRGWLENPDFSSSCFHLKFSVFSRDVDHAYLTPSQIVNHFTKSTNITTKSGLSQSIKNSIWAANENEDNYFPKCFESFEDSEFNAFVEYYKLLRAESVLKKVLALGASQQRDSEEYRLLCEGLLPTALEVTKRRLLSLDQIIDCKKHQIIKDEEWEVLKVGEKDEGDMLQAIKAQNEKRYVVKKKNKKKKKKKKTQVKTEQIKKDEGGLEGETGQTAKETDNIDGVDDQEDGEEGEEEGEPEEQEEKLPSIEVEITEVLDKLKKLYPQTTMNGASNIWIVKPAGLSRGRGIKLYNSLLEITNQVRSKDLSWVVQKYIENPLLYKNKKLDIRQWVMVTDWNPLTIWFYQECYIRLTAADYNSNNLKDRYSHLTNNSVNKNSKRFEKEAGFLNQTDFAEYLKTMGYESEDPFMKVIQPRMKEIVKASLMCVQDMVENRKNSSEMYGYDFSIDDQLGVWLIEINSSPAWDYSSVRSSSL